MPPKKPPTKPTPPPDVEEKSERPLGPRLSWSGEIEPTSGVGIARCYHAAALWEGKLFLFGGWSGKSTTHIREVQSFDFSSRTWQNVETSGEPHDALSQCATASTPQGVLFVGGWNGQSRSTALTTFNFVSHQWEPMPLKERTLPGLTFHTATYVHHRVFVFGGNTVEGQSNDMLVIDPTLQSITTATVLGAPSKRSSHTATLVHEELIVVIGGRGGADGSQVLGDVCVFDTTSAGQWNMNIRVEGALPPRYGHSAVAIGDNILIYGGISDQGTLLNDVWMLNCEKPHVFTWSKAFLDGAPPDPRSGHAAIESLGSMLVVGGRCDGGVTKCDVVGMDTSSLAPLPTMNESVARSEDHVSPTPGTDQQ